jgi:hypothetical protein
MESFYRGFGSLLGLPSPTPSIEKRGRSPKNATTLHRSLLISVKLQATNVSITRAKETLVISRALRIGRGSAKQLGLTVTTGNAFWEDLKMSPFPSRHNECAARRCARRVLERLRTEVSRNSLRALPIAEIRFSRSTNY